MKKILFIACLYFAGLLPANAQWSTDTLSSPAYGLFPVQVGSKAIFASGAIFEIYDFSTDLWTSRPLSLARTGIRGVVAGGKAYFGGGGFITVWNQVMYKNVDIYNSATDTWSVTNLSQARLTGASAAVGSKVLFAGGRQVLSYSKRVDIFDVNTGVRTTASLSQARHNMAVAVIGSKVIFAGGETGSIVNGKYVSSNKVDIYDDATGTWSTALLSVKREQIAVAIVGSKVLFAGGLNNSGTGGQYSNRVDIYDAVANTWSIANMSEGKYGIAAAVSGNKAYFAGGTTYNSGALSNRVEIYDALANTWSYITLSSPRMSMAAGVTPQRIMFAGGTETWGNAGSARVEVLDLATNTWSVEYLSQPRLGIAAVSNGNKVLFAGGAEVLSSYPQYSIISNKVDIWTDPAPRFANTDIYDRFTGTLSLYPNPVEGNTVVVNFTQSGPRAVRIRLTDLSGRVLMEKTAGDEMRINTGIDLSGFARGTYMVNVMAGDFSASARLMLMK